MQCSTLKGSTFCFSRCRWIWTDKIKTISEFWLFDFLVIDMIILVNISKSTYSMLIYEHICYFAFTCKVHMLSVNALHHIHILWRSVGYNCPSYMILKLNAGKQIILTHYQLYHIVSTHSIITIDVCGMPASSQSILKPFIFI